MGCARSHTKQNYVEIVVPVPTEAKWMAQLQGLYPKDVWQEGHFHITAVFVNDDRCVRQLCEAFDRVLSGRKAPIITIDQLDAFVAARTKEIIVHLASSQPFEELQALIDDLRAAAQGVGANINPHFILHVTLGRIPQRYANLDEVRRAISTVALEPFTAPITEINYRYKDHDHTRIKPWRLSISE